MEYSYDPRGVCSRNINFTIEDGVVRDISFSGGCEGSLKGLSELIKGRKAEDVIALLSGIRCGMKATSCPDQLAAALKEAVKGMV